MLSSSISDIRSYLRRICDYLTGYNPHVPKTDILIVGGGAREHALAWKLAQSKRVGTLYVAPGNAGTESFCINVDIPAINISELAKFASAKNVGLTIVGPDEPLALGIVDQFKRSGLRIFGPTKAAAKLESSKVYAKKLMHEAGIPTAGYRAFTDAEQAHAYAIAGKFPVVVKANGLAAGKGVCVCETVEQAAQAIDDLMVKKVYGDAGAEVIIEEFLVGEEISVHAATDGVNVAMFPASQDHKRAGDGNTGKNTGGMGVIAPVPWVTGEMMMQIENTIVRPLIRILGEKGAPYQGILYPGIMITSDGPKVIELNVRFGDPECQAYMRILATDLMDLLDECVDGGIGTHVPVWDAVGTVNVVLASGGYPDDFVTGHVISGIKDAERNPNIVVFHAGTIQDNELRTAGGRVLTVSATGVPIDKALELAYTAIHHISFENMYYRHDIGQHSINPGMKNIPNMPKY